MRRGRSLPCCHQGPPTCPYMDAIRPAQGRVCEVGAPATSQCPGPRPVSIRGLRAGPPAHSPPSSTCSQVGWLNQGRPPALSIRAGSTQHHGQIQMLPQQEQVPAPETQVPPTEEAMLQEAEEERQGALRAGGGAGGAGAGVPRTR